jgi:dTDP-4-amino-4,6-dideoxygalactose transaminase
MIHVTKPFLPDMDKFRSYLDGIWQREYLTNNGPLVQELEAKLKPHFDSKHVLFTSNGTISIQIALKALDLVGTEVITTPFSYVATSSSLLWENCKPVFADIDLETFNISPDEIKKAITPNTKAILATHVFGNPCAIDEIETIAKENNLLVIYDAAHCFGTTYKNKSVMSFGDVSSISFHATKLFHTTEGGALICQSDELAKQFSLKRNFGHNGFDVFDGVGINGKNSEFHAAMGLCNLEHIDEIVSDRKAIHSFYDKHLAGLPLKKQKIQENTTVYNCSYYPVLFENEETLLKVKSALEQEQIFSRRYFYPSLNTLSFTQGECCPNSEYIAERILCLPVFFQIGEETISRIANIIRTTLNG